MNCTIQKFSLGKENKTSLQCR